MAWRTTEFLIEGELDNTILGCVTGWMKFAGIKEKVVFDLKGDFHRDIRGAKIYFKGDVADIDETKARAYMDGFLIKQTGKVGDITAGLPPYDYIQGRVYIEWYSNDNGRVVIELPQESLKIIGEPLPADKSEPISRKEQAENMAGFMQEVAEQFELK